LEYEHERKQAAKKLDFRTKVIDKLVTAVRNADADAEPGLYAHWNVEAASETVDGHTLLEEIRKAIRRYVFMSEVQEIAVTLWIVFSWLHEFVTHSPILFVTSPEKDSGKTTLLGVLNFLTHRALQCVDITGPALFRSITKW
jgi:hypothetical protein